MREQASGERGAEDAGRGGVGVARVWGLPACRLVTAGWGPRWQASLVPVRVSPSAPRRPPETLLEEELLTHADGQRTVEAIRRSLECREASVAEALEHLVRRGWLRLTARLER